MQPVASAIQCSLRGFLPCMLYMRAVRALLQQYDPHQPVQYYSLGACGLVCQTAQTAMLSVTNTIQEPLPALF